LLLLNLSEGVRPKGAGWFFHEDLTPDLLLWPIGFLFIGKLAVQLFLTSDLLSVCGISGALALFFAIGLNLAGLACLLPISPSTYNLLILPIVILTDALTAAILGAVYYMVRSRATALVHFLTELCSLGILGLSLGRSCECISIEETSTVISSYFRQVFSLSCCVCF
jgi:hypothetical protein